MAEASPFALAMRRFASRTGVRVGLTVLGLVVLSATYAPILATDIAWIWRDEAGLRFPVLVSLFNRRIYPHPHDLLFNLVAVLLPFLMAGWFALRRRWSVLRRLLVTAAVVVGAFGLCHLPALPRGDTRVPLWADRPAPTEIASDLHEGIVRADLAVFAPIPHRVDSTYAGAVLKEPLTRNPATGARFWLGTDVRGHDVAAQMLFGARISLTIGFVATGISMLIGTLIGAASGYFGGKVDLILQRLVEIMLCFPTFVIVLTVVAMTSRSIFIIMVVLGLTGWAGIARLVRGEFLAHAVRDYVTAAQALGLGGWRIMLRHILPNALTPLLISASFGIAGAVGTESGLAFLGLGDPNAPSWGLLLNQGRENISYAWLIYVPGLAVFVLVMLLNLLGSALSEALDPKQGN